MNALDYSSELSPKLLSPRARPTGLIAWLRPSRRDKPRERVKAKGIEPVPLDLLHPREDLLERLTSTDEATAKSIGSARRNRQDGRYRSLNRHLSSIELL